MNRLAAITGAALIAVALTASSSVAAGPPPPTAANGNEVAVVGSGVAFPAQFAWRKGDMFIAGGAEGKIKGGLYVIKKGSGKTKLVPGVPKAVYGAAFSAGRLYVSTGSRILGLGKWNGKRFKNKWTVLKANKKDFLSLNGVSIAPSGRIYAGVSFEFDSAASKKKYASSVISVKKSGKGVKVISNGIRQPWQLTFLPGDNQPYVTGLAQDTPEGTDAADFIAKVKPGADFGFPTCTWGVSSPCDGFTKPVALFPPIPPLPSTSPTGITHQGQKLFVALFRPYAPAVITMDKTGGSIKEFLTGFAAPAIAVGVHKGYLYSSDASGQIYKVEL